ncbi:hypothetical protein BH23ACT9_BH23ACT9_20390 [soil metagenome]
MVTLSAPDPLLLRGTLTTFRRRCGKPSCHCADGEPHASPALTFTEGGTKTVTLRAAEVAEVAAAALARYQAARDALEEAAEAGIHTLRSRQSRS